MSVQNGLIGSFFLVTFSLLMMPPNASAVDAQNASQTGAGSQFYEVRQYVLGKQGDAAAVDAYLKNALIPALQRQGIGPIGAFEPSDSDQTGSDAIFVVIPFSNLNELQASQQELADDEAYQTAAADYLDRPHTDPPYQRIRSEVLSSLACWPVAKVADGLLENGERVYELRVYESANEKIADTKIDMFNAGEVPIFLDCGIEPIFIGKCIAGPQMPSMTYLTTYPNEQARLEAWKAFQVHPDWQTLKVVPKYLGTVSRIDKFVLQPKPYSQM
ncbi:NIPSNAP family protein [Neorhodopirellula pilleata]|uniref:NIPSNAP domain-containing protein n=1 Tax=Neorhodopirellula pilleata TaxID=2714738 RepID=A0A5C6AIB5_9BACT|nr:NIPSNAP family protein [Neorhodopirellula pilleata]TWT98988.1 hypothetical protein Pla100_21540 [Neorhodopirellula pilleata]